MSTVANKEPGTIGSFVLPEVDVLETGEAYVLQAEMPGVGKDGVEITVDGNELTLVGHRGAGALKADSLYRESNSADYQRVFELDPAIDTSNIDARIDQGVLTLRLPKSERGKPRKVTVTD